MDAFLTALWAFVNSPVGLTLIGAIAAWAIARLFAWQPAWEPWRGTIIAAIRYAERIIPDDTQNSAAAKLDAALKHVLLVYQTREGKPPPATLREAFEEGIQVIHNEIEGKLENKTKTAGKVMTLFLCLALLGTGGCGLFSQDPKAELLAARHTYVGVVNVLTLARQQGAFTRARAEMIGQYVDLGAEALNKWEAKLRMGEDPDTIIGMWHEILTELMAAQIEAEQSKTGPTPSSPPYDDPFNPSESRMPVAMVPITRARRRRRRASGIVDALAVLTALLELGLLGERWAALAQRVLKGETVTWEEVEAAKADCEAARQGYHAAAKFDKPE